MICSNCQNDECFDCLDCWTYGDEEVSCICDCTKDVVDLDDDSPFYQYSENRYDYDWDDEYN